MSNQSKFIKPPRHAGAPKVIEEPAVTHYEFKNRPGSQPDSTASTSTSNANSPSETSTATTTPRTEKSYSEINPDFVDVDLPSNFQMYLFKKLAIRHPLGSAYS